MTDEGTAAGAARSRPLLALDFDLRHPPQLGATGPATYAAALDIIGWADEHGFERVGFGEHHQSDDGYLPCPLVFAAAVGARTKRIRIRISILLALLYDPLRLAEEVAVADLCPGGRPRGPIFLWVTTDDKQRTWERLAPHIRHQIDSYGAWTKAGLGKATGPYIPSGDVESLSQGGAYQVVTPDEALALAEQLGPSG